MDYRSVWWPQEIPVSRKQVCESSAKNPPPVRSLSLAHLFFFLLLFCGSAAARLGGRCTGRPGEEGGADVTRQQQKAFSFPSISGARRPPQPGPAWPAPPHTAASVSLWVLANLRAFRGNLSLLHAYWEHVYRSHHGRGRRGVDLFRLWETGWLEGLGSSL